MKLRKELWRRGYRYRKNYTELPGKPDIYISKYNVAIFINGCFWHHHYNCKYSYIPKTNQKYWINKFDRNMKNDIKHYKQLKQMDIRVIIIWECELKECFNYRMEILEEEIKNSKEE